MHRGEIIHAKNISIPNVEHDIVDARPLPPPPRLSTSPTTQLNTAKMLRCFRPCHHSIHSFQYTEVVKVEEMMMKIRKVISK